MSRCGRVVITFRLDKLKTLLEKKGVASGFKLGTRVYPRESCHTFIVAEDEQVVQTVTAFCSKAVVTLSKEAEWPAKWEWRWNVNTERGSPEEFDQVDIAVALPELEIPLDAVASIKLLEECRHVAYRWLGTKVALRTS